MISFLSPILDKPYLYPPTGFGWVVWFALLGVTVLTLYRWREVHSAWGKQAWGIFVVLFISIPLTTLLFGARITTSGSLPPPGVPTDQFGAALLPLSALPWILAGGLLGPLGAALLGGFTGLARGLWDTHSLFTLLEFALLGALYSSIVQQQFRTRLYRWVRNPFVAVLGLIPLRALLYVIGAYFSNSWDTTARVDYALSSVGMVTLAFTVEILSAGLVAQIVAVAFPNAWGRDRNTQPSPVERSLETRFLVWTSTFILVLLITLLVGDWVVAGTAARRMLQERLSSTAEMAAQSVPFFLETGQNLAVQLASTPDARESVDPELSNALGNQIQAVAYFDQAFVLDATSRDVLGCYPDSACQSFRIFPEEDAGLLFALSDVPNQIYSIPPANIGDPARLSFIIAIKNDLGQINRILLARTNLGVNPLTQPLIQSLTDMSALNGTGILLDENGLILFDPNPNLIMSQYTGETSAAPSFYDGTAPDGTRQLIYYQPVVGRSWAIVLMVPARQTQQLALNVALPLSVMIFVLAMIALVLLRFGLRGVTRSLRDLTSEANRLAQGQLDRPLQIEGEDEVGQLGRAFEQMRVSLQARMEELNRLLVVSRGVGSTLNLQEAVKPVLEAALVSGASAVRIVLSQKALPEIQNDFVSYFSLGANRDVYAYLDDQILSLAEQQERFVIPDVSRATNLLVDENEPHPGSLIAVALRHKNRYFGALWVAFDRPHQFSRGDVNYVATLAGQTALAASNVNLFMDVEVGRRQLEAILNSTPDPVLVIDPKHHLILANRAAGQALGPDVETGEGKLVERVISQKPLLELLQADGEKQSAEVTLSDERTYLATASSVVADGHSVGRVCIMRDVTHFKELDTLKSEFVSTVSHDLRSPLTLMRGYATMMNMAGPLNEQQKGYVGKIITGVENMARLVNNLLDLGRIELGVGLELEAVSPLDILEKITGALQLSANQKRIELSLELPKELPRFIEADPALLHQAIYNLVENAIKYTPEGKQVFVRVHNIPNGIVFDVQDTGIGISPEDLTRLFERFYRGKSREARAQHGTGLGLAIVRSIAERHGGRVWVESEEGKGSRFYLQIPLRQPK